MDRWEGAVFMGKLLTSGFAPAPLSLVWNIDFCDWETDRQTARYRLLLLYKYIFIPITDKLIFVWESMVAFINIPYISCIYSYWYYLQAVKILILFKTVKPVEWSDPSGNNSECALFLHHISPFRIIPALKCWLSDRKWWWSWQRRQMMVVLGRNPESSWNGVD